MGLRPFTENDSNIFFGRTRDTEALLNRVYASRTVVVFAPSGVGKTSLLRAGVFNQLQKDKEVYAVYLNDWTKPCLDQVVESLSRFSSEKAKTWADCVAKGLSTQGTLASPQFSLLNFVREFWSKTGVKPILILDQFEEVLRYHTNRGIIWDHLSPLMNAISAPARVVLSLREDYLGILDELMNRVPGLLENRYRVQPLSLDGIRQAIVEPLALLNPPFNVQSELLIRIVDDFDAKRRDATSDDRVEAGYLQLVCQRLWEIEKSGPERIIHLDTYNVEGGIDRIVEAHINRVLFTALDDRQRHLLYAMTRYLVTPTGAKVSLTAKDLSELIREEDFSVVGRKLVATTQLAAPISGESQSFVVEGSIVEVMDTLCKPEILILRRKQFRQRVTYELCHDVLGTILLKWRSRVTIEENEEAQRQAELAKKAQQEAERALLEAKEGWTGALVSIAVLVMLLLLLYICASTYVIALAVYPKISSIALSTVVILLFRIYVYCFNRRTTVGRFILIKVAPFIPKKFRIIPAILLLGSTLMTTVFELRYRVLEEENHSSVVILAWVFGSGDPWWASVLCVALLISMVGWIYFVFCAIRLCIESQKVLSRFIACLFVLLSFLNIGDVVLHSSTELSHGEWVWSSKLSTWWQAILYLVLPWCGAVVFVVLPIMRKWEERVRLKSSQKR